MTEVQPEPSWESDDSSSEDEEDQLMNEHLNVPEFEHGCEHGHNAW